MHHNIIMTGMVGSGKSTVGKLLAQRMNMRFVDLDELITRRQDRTPQQLVRTHGESYFRQIEHEVFKEIVEWQDYIIATGGGTLVKPENFTLLTSYSLLICLDCDPEFLWQRLESMQNRPVLQHPERTPKEQLFHLVEVRKEVYAKVPSHINTTNRTVDTIVDEAIALYQRMVS